MDDAIYRLAQLAYLMLPVYVANMAPPFSRYWSGWNRPISRRWLGEHKTVVGFALGLVAAVMTAFIQSRVHWEGGMLPYDQWLLLGFATGLGAMGGDSLKSFFKRRLGIGPGRPWIPADQLDFIIGGLLMLSFWVNLSWTDAVYILVVSFAGDILVNHISFRLGIRDTRW